MKTIKKIVLSGFVIAIFGWISVALSFDRTIGLSIFFIGFTIAAVGIVLSPFHLGLNQKLRFQWAGIKIGSVGVGIACLSVPITWFFNYVTVANYLFWIGLIMTVIGIIVIIVSVANSNVN